MILAKPLLPKNDDGILRVIIPARISTPSQDPESNKSQHADAEQSLRRAYAGPIDIRLFSDQASGWLANRTTMVEAQALIETGDWDLVIAGELREIYRNPQFQWAFVHMCLDNDTRVICIGDRIDTAEDGWEVMMHTACLRHGMTVPETKRRVNRKATHAFENGGMVTRVRYGYSKLTKEQADSGEFGPKGLRIAKEETATIYLNQMRLRTLQGESYEMIADWLNDEGVPPGRYTTNGKWTGKLVRSLLRDTILSGQRRFRKGISQLVYGSGKHKRKVNPEPPEMKEYPELAHFTPEEHRELLAAMDARKGDGTAGTPSGRASPLYNVPRARSLWPGQAVRCGACGGSMYNFGPVLKCQNARGQGPRECWNRVQVRVDEIHARVLPFVLQYLDTHPRFKEIIVQTAWREYQRVRNLQNRSTAGLDAEITDLATQAKRLAKAIAQGGPLDSLVAEATEVQKKLTKASAERARLAAQDDKDGTFRSVVEVSANLDEALSWLAATSRDFAGILRRLIPTFVVIPVQNLDRPQVRPRAKLVISAAAWAMDGETVPDLEATVNLFEPPVHIKHMPACLEVRRRDAGAPIRPLMKKLGIGKMTVKRALAYHLLMQQAGVSDPYRELTACPTNASRWRGRGRQPSGTKKEGESGR